MTAIEIIAKFRTRGASCCTDGCFPEAKVKLMLEYALKEEATKEETGHEVRRSSEAGLNFEDL